MTDPRIQRTRQAVRQATLSVLADRGFVDFTVEAVADAADVSKSTIYRHWPTRLALIEDALETLNQQPGPELDGSSTRRTIQQLLEHLAAAFADSQLSACVPALIEAAERHPEVADFLHGYNARRRASLVHAIQEGIETGELPPHLDAELTALALIGPIIYRRTMTSEPLPAGEIPALLDLVLGSSG